MNQLFSQEKTDSSGSLLFEDSQDSLSKYMNTNNEDTNYLNSSSHN